MNMHRNQIADIHDQYGKTRQKVRDSGGFSKTEFEIDWADCASTVNIGTLSGLATTADGVAMNTAGMRILLKNQTTPGLNGLYSVAAGAWSKSGQPKSVKILKGTTQGRTWFDLTAANVYQGGCAFYG